MSNSFPLANANLFCDTQWCYGDIWRHLVRILYTPKQEKKLQMRITQHFIEASFHYAREQSILAPITNTMCRIA